MVDEIPSTKRKREARNAVYGALMGNNLYYHECCQVLEELLEHFQDLDGSWNKKPVEEKKFPIWNYLAGHLGFIQLPTDIYGVEIGEDHVIFDCRDAFYRVDMKDARTVCVSKKKKEE